MMIINGFICEIEITTDKYDGEIRYIKMAFTDDNLQLDDIDFLKMVNDEIYKHFSHNWYVSSIKFIDPSLPDLNGFDILNHIKNK